MGNGLSYERNTLDYAPAPPAYFEQSLDINASALEVKEINPVVAGLDSAGRIVVYPTLQAYLAVGNLAKTTGAIYRDGIQYAGDFVANMEQFFVVPPGGGQAVSDGTYDLFPANDLSTGTFAPVEADWGLHFTLQNGPGSQLKKSEWDPEHSIRTMAEPAQQTRSMSGCR